MNFVSESSDVTNDTNVTNLVTLPIELQGASEDVILLYNKWLAIDLKIKSSKRRYFSFVNQQTKELEQVDAVGIAGVVLRLARTKHISDTDIKRLETICEEFTDLKLQKSMLKRRWMSFVKDKKGGNVFDWCATDIVEMLSRFMTVDEVKKRLQQKGYETSTNSIHKFFLANKDIIDKKRLEFIRSSHDHYLATDAGRMETLAVLHARFVQMFNDVYNTPNASKEELRQLSREIRAIVEQARKEIKGEEVRLTVDGKIDINASLNAVATIQDISKRIPINVIPVYLVAAKTGTDPNKIMTALVRSYYKDFNGFAKLAESGVTPPNTMEIIRNYDWNEIMLHQQRKKEEKTETVNFEDVTDEQKPIVKSKRQKLIDLLNKQKADNPPSQL